MNGAIGIARALNTGRLAQFTLCCPIDVVDVRLYSLPQPSLRQRQRSRLGISSSLRRLDRSRLRSTTPSPTASCTSSTSLASLPLSCDSASDVAIAELSRVVATESGGDTDSEERAVDELDVLALLLPPFTVSWAFRSTVRLEGDVTAEAEREWVAPAASLPLIDQDEDEDEADLARGDPESDTAERDDTSGEEAGDMCLERAGSEEDRTAGSADDSGRLVGMSEVPAGSCERRLESALAVEASALRGRSFVSIITMLQHTAAGSTDRQREEKRREETRGEKARWAD